MLGLGICPSESILTSLQGINKIWLSKSLWVTVSIYEKFLDEPVFECFLTSFSFRFRICG